ncbi:MAG: carbohydrate ABC transporter permease [Tenericutes bacterium]|nr:carbohydrate ABC transporter permease [Mycoplasmatota bacterium]
MNNVRKSSLFYFAVILIASAVIIPMMYLVNTSISSAIEVNDFPKQILPVLSHDMRIEWDDENSYYIISRKSFTGEYKELTYSSKFDRIETYLITYLNISKTEEEIEEDFIVARNTGEIVYLNYNKDIFNNFGKFFEVFDGANAALVNSVKAAALTIVLSMSIGGSVGYALARTKMKGKDAISLGSLVVRMFPAVSISVPMAVLLVKFGMYDTMLGLAIIYSIPNIGLTAWITRSIFMSVNPEFEEASLVFGASKLQTFKSITFPLVLPAFAASSMYAFITAWNDTAVSLLLTNDNETLALLIYKSMGGSASIHYAASGAILLILPALAFTFLLKNYINKMWG